MSLAHGPGCHGRRLGWVESAVPPKHRAEGPGGWTKGHSHGPLSQEVAPNSDLGSRSWTLGLILPTAVRCCLWVKENSRQGRRRRAWPSSSGGGRFKGPTLPRVLYEKSSGLFKLRGSAKIEPSCCTRWCWATVNPGLLPRAPDNLADSGMQEPQQPGLWCCPLLIFLTHAAWHKWDSSSPATIQTHGAPYTGSIVSQLLWFMREVQYNLF